MMKNVELVNDGPSQEGDNTVYENNDDDDDPDVGADAPQKIACYL